MKFSWIHETEVPLQVKTFLKEKGISKKMLAKIKFHGGKISVDEQEQNVLFQLQKGQTITIDIPAEPPHETLRADDMPLDIVFEDEHLLVINKPANIASIPSQYHPKNTMANRVKFYLCAQNYENQVVHIVTRLDKDTSGLMVFAKHGFAHSKLDEQLREKTFIKMYFALVGGAHDTLTVHDFINLPIARATDSIMQRTVSETGKSALTEYWLQKMYPSFSLVNIQLHTGRTHQIRVHFAAIGCPLLGDDLYGGATNLGIVRQALHCHQIQFNHPFTNEPLLFRADIPEDIKQLTGNLLGELDGPN